MIIRNSNSPRTGRYPRAGTGAGSSTGPAPKSHLVIPEPCFVGSEFRNQAGDNLADAGRLVFIEFGRSGIAVPCLFKSFHAQPDSQREREDNAA